MQIGALFEQMPGHVNSRWFSSVARVFLERKSKHGNVLAGDGIKHGLHNALTETRFLVLVHVDNLLPIRRHLGQIERFAYVHQVENILLETAATETNGSLNENEP